MAWGLAAGLLWGLADYNAASPRARPGRCAMVVAFLAIAALSLGNAYYAAEYGWLLPIFLSRGFATVFLLSLRAAGGSTASAWLPVVLLAVLDTGGYIAFNLGAERADTSIVSAASAPYAVIPIVAGVLLFRERPPPVQWLGVTAVIVGVVLLGLTS